MMPELKKEKFFSAPGVRHVWHISRLTADRVWISDSYGNLILTNTKGEVLDHLTDLAYGAWGMHTVSNTGELIYIDGKFDINKLSTGNREKSTFIKFKKPWKPQCVFPSDGNLLVGMYKGPASWTGTFDAGKVIKYNSTGTKFKTIELDNTGRTLYRWPHYITENCNGDIIVADIITLGQGSIVVTDNGGNYRFTYTGHQPGSLFPRGICTNALSQILVCDYWSKTVQMIDKDGNFQSLILTKPQGNDIPQGISYDKDNDMLWVGSADHPRVDVYKYICEEPQYDLENQLEDILQHMKTEKTIVRHARGIVVGCVGAGKTTLLYSLMGKSLEEINSIESTRGLQVHEHIFCVQDKSFKATDNLSRKPLITIPKSSLAKSKDKSEVLGQKMTMDKDILPKKEDTVDVSKGRDESRDEGKDINLPSTSNVKLDQKSPQIMVSNAERKTSDTQAKDIVVKTLSSEVIKKILDIQEDEIRVSMIDFAGQFVYYASHQIYMSSKAFYILVMDITKSFEEVVSGEEEEQKCSIFSTWKYKDYVEFWLNSIKSFGGPKAPVLIVATHAEGKTEDDKDIFFENLWKSLTKEDNSWLDKHGSDEEFAFGLLKMKEDEKSQTLQLLKKSIVDVVSNKMDTKIQVRSSWALLEHLLQKSGKPIMSCDEIKELNEKLPEEYRLECNREIPEFLSIFHDHGVLLYFKSGATSTHVILDMQWFSDAFSILIADKKHINKDCRRQHITDWNSFNKTGELKSTLVDALWKDKREDSPNIHSYKNYKNELMAYMEKLQMLVKIGEIDLNFSWYVPCMNKKPFKVDNIKEGYLLSSVLCFRFTSFAMFVFYRLIAYCMSSLKWKVVPDKEGKCLYQKAAMFEHKNHNVLLCICDRDIQLQVMVIKASSMNIETDVSYEIGFSINNVLKELTRTFSEMTNLKFQRGYKCDGCVSFIEEEKLTQSGYRNIHCPCLECKHEIKIENTLRYWVKSMQPEPGNRQLDDFTDSERKKRGPRTRSTYPFSKPDRPKDALTSHIKTEVTRSVGLIYIHGKPEGTGFRVGEKYIMTCLHVIKDIIGPQDFFSWESICIQFEKMAFLQKFNESKIFHFGPTVVYKNEGYDVVVLELKKGEIEFPPPLTSFYANRLPSEEVHLIGHPGGVQMKEDSEVYLNDIEPNNDADDYIAELSEWSKKKFKGVDYYRSLRYSPRKILFHTTFDKGSSGSPGILIRNNEAVVVLIVRGGAPINYYDKGIDVEPERRIEYGHALRDVFVAMQTNENDKILSTEIFKKWVS